MEEKIKQLYTEGKSLTAIAKELNTTTTTIVNNSKALGLVWGWKRFEQKKLDRMHAVIMPYIEDAKKGNPHKFTWVELSRKSGMGIISLKYWSKKLIRYGVISRTDFYIISKSRL